MINQCLKIIQGKPKRDRETRRFRSPVASEVLAILQLAKRDHFGLLRKPRYDENKGVIARDEFPKQSLNIRKK